MKLSSDNLITGLFIIVSLFVVYLFFTISRPNNFNKKDTKTNIKKIEIFLKDNNQLKKGVMLFSSNKVDFYIYTDSGKLGGELTNEKANNILNKGEKDGTVLRASYDDHYIQKKTGNSLHQIAKVRSVVIED